MGSPACIVFGVGRSGTSILRHVLSEHPRLLVSHELRVLELALLAAAVVDAAGETPTVEPKGYSAFGLELGRAFATALGDAQLASAGKTGGLYGDKYPPYGLHVPALAALFPGARFVHIVRDGRDVAASALQAYAADRGWRRSGRLPSVAELARQWAAQVRTGRAHLARLGSARGHELRYEALLDEREPVLAALFAFLGLDAGADLARLASMLLPGKSWRDTLAHGELVEFDAVPEARAQLEELGYPPTPTAQDEYARACPARASTFGLAGPDAWRAAMEAARARGAGDDARFAARRVLAALETDAGRDPRGLAAARTLLARPDGADSPFGALVARDARDAETRGALATWCAARGLDPAAARALYAATEAEP
ncbi:MAG: sulfotransferase [Planctomycetes bacterium]|nr:sulfotransferase [Planctomycetota bacterium]